MGVVDLLCDDGGFYVVVAWCRVGDDWYGWWPFGFLDRWERGVEALSRIVEELRNGGDDWDLVDARMVR